MWKFRCETACGDVLINYYTCTRLMKVLDWKLNVFSIAHIDIQSTYIDIESSYQEYSDSDLTSTYMYEKTVPSIGKYVCSSLIYPQKIAITRLQGWISRLPRNTIRSNRIKPCHRGLLLSILNSLSTQCGLNKTTHIYRELFEMNFP